MKLKHVLFLLVFVLTSQYGFTQIEEYKKQLLGTWVHAESEDNILLRRADAFEAEKYGMTFYDDGTLTRRSAKGLFDVIWFDHPGKWHFEDSTLILLYMFDEKQKAQEKVIITQLDDQYLRFDRIDWVEIRE